MDFQGKCAIKLVHGLPKLEPSRIVSSKVIKSLVYGATSTCKNRGSMDPVHILMDLVHGPSPQRGSMFVLSHRSDIETSIFMERASEKKKTSRLSKIKYL